MLFKVTCHDETGLIGEALHRRAFINIARLMQPLQKQSPTRQ
ncbi:hypothetical protein [Aquitalea denitrificans]